MKEIVNHMIIMRLKQIAIESLILGACLAVATWVFYELAMAICGQ